MSAIVSVRNVSKDYMLGKTVVPALRDVSLEVDEGDFLSIAGPSGSGKTTLLNLVGCVDTPTAGSVVVNGEDTTRLSERALTELRLRTIGFIFQSFNLVSVLSVFQNVEFPLLLQGALAKKERQARVLALLEAVGLGEHTRHRPSELSGGQRQRVAIAQQFICSHYFLLMDEPFSGLDPLAVDRVCKLVNEVAQADELNTIIIVTHNIEAGLKVADTVLLLGRDHDEKGAIIPGARIQAVYDLAKMGLAWRENVDTLPEFLELEREIRAKFRDL